MARRKKQVKRPATPKIQQVWSKSRGTDDKGRPQFVYKLGGFEVFNRVTLPLVRGFSE